MYEVIQTAFFDELDKISGAKIPTAIAAHEMGHAKDYEGSIAPGLRAGVRKLAPFAGIGGALLTKTPLGAAAALGAGTLPMLADEASASYNAMKHLKKSGKFKKEELTSMRNQLLQAGGGYAAVAAGAVGAAAAAKARNLPLAGASLLGGISAALGLGALAGRNKDRHASTLGELAKLRKGMGVRAKIYRTEGQPIQASYVRKGSAAFRAKNKDVRGRRNKKAVRETFERGGIFLPTG